MPVEENGNKIKWNSLERHVTTIMVTIVTGLIIFMAATVYGSSVELSAIKNELTNLRSQISEMKIEYRDRYTKQDASRDFAVRDERLAELRRRIERLERNAGDHGE